MEQSESRFDDPDCAVERVRKDAPLTEALISERTCRILRRFPAKSGLSVPVHVLDKRPSLFYSMLTSERN
jgi:hypothetical protein